jgi:hypothetical protein
MPADCNQVVPDHVVLRTVHALQLTAAPLAWLRGFVEHRSSPAPGSLRKRNMPFSLSFGRCAGTCTRFPGGSRNCGIPLL